MRRFSKAVFYIAGSIVVLLMVAVVALPLLLNAGAYREQLQAYASTAAGMQVHITGPLRVQVFPGLQVVVNDVRASRDGDDIASAGALAIGIDLLPLFRRVLKINHIVMQDPVLWLERYPDGRFNIESVEDDAGPLPALDLDSIAISNGTVHYREGQSGSTYVANACNGDIGELVLKEGPRDDFFVNLVLQADLVCGDVSRNGFAVNDVSMTVAGSEGVFTADPITLSVFGATGTGNLTANVSGGVPQYELSFSLPQFHSDAVVGAMAAEQTVTGNLNFSAMLTMQGTNVDALTQSMAGQLSLQGEQLVLHGVALDEELARFESTQNFNIVDIGALFFAGPLGLAVTKGYDYANLLQDTGSRSEIRALVSEWTVMNGVTGAEDVALTTTRNRIALAGSLDFNTGQFADMKVAVVDANGCVLIEQAIHGSFQEPVIDKPGILQSLAAPALSLVERGIELLPGEEDCDGFYNGRLPHPE